MCPQFLWLNVVKTDQNMLNPHLEPRPHPPGAPGALKSPRLSLSSVSWPSTAGRSKWSKTADSGGFWSYLHMVKIAKFANFRATTFDIWPLQFGHVSEFDTPNAAWFNKCWSFATMSVFGNHPHAAATSCAFGTAQLWHASFLLGPAGDWDGYKPVGLQQWEVTD